MPQPPPYISRRAARYVYNRRHAGIPVTQVAREVRKLWPDYKTFSPNDVLKLLHKMGVVFGNARVPVEKQTITLAGPKWSVPIGYQCSDKDVLNGSLEKHPPTSPQTESP